MAGALVIFGITGDLAKKMTFRSLYRLEQRGLLSCPVIGVAVDDWSVDRLRDHARESIKATGQQLDDEVFNRFAQRLSYVSGDFGQPETYERVADALREAHDPVYYLEIPPSLFATVVKGLAQQELLADGQGRPARHRAGPSEIELDMEFAEEGGEGATPYEVLLHAALVGDSTYFTRQDMVEETWRIVQPLLDDLPEVKPYAPGS